ncbi:MAG: hypothetical protein U0X73_18470 [Thermoanaerobaculia bacterium]
MTPKRIALALVFAVAALVSGVRLYWMGQIRGWIPGATVEKTVVTQKWHQTPDEHPNHINVYWIAWTAKPITESGTHRADLDVDRWSSLEIGSPVEVVRLAGSDQPYLRAGIFDSSGNFLAVGTGFAVALVLAIKFLRDMFARKTGPPEPEELHLFTPTPDRPH